MSSCCLRKARPSAAAFLRSDRGIIMRRSVLFPRQVPQTPRSDRCAWRRVPFSRNLVAAHRTSYLPGHEEVSGFPQFILPVLPDPPANIHQRGTSTFLCADTGPSSLQDHISLSLVDLPIFVIAGSPLRRRRP